MSNVMLRAGDFVYINELGAAVLILKCEYVDGRFPCSVSYEIDGVIWSRMLDVGDFKIMSKYTDGT